jgi:hypothetical protein
MDPITALANLITALTNLVKVVIEGQPPEVKKQLWDWYVTDVAKWRKLFKLDG